MGAQSIIYGKALPRRNKCTAWLPVSMIKIYSEMTGGGGGGGMKMELNCA